MQKNEKMPLKWLKRHFFSDEKDKSLFQANKGIFSFAVGLQFRIKEKYYIYLNKSRARIGVGRNWASQYLRSIFARVQSFLL